jgi:hypothetical protein
MHNNTIYFKNRNNNPGMFAALFLSSWGKFGSPSNFSYKNNLVYLDNNTSYAWKNVTGTWSQDYNLVYAPSGNLNIHWGSTLYSTLAQLCTATGQDCHSIQANPLLVNPGGRATTDYMIGSGSPAINAGIDVGGMGTRDYFGNAIPQGGAYDIGAHESNGAPPPPTNTPVPPTNTPVPPTPTKTPTPGGPTNTPVPPTNTPIPPTNTPVPPTATPGGGTVMHVSAMWSTDSAGNPQTVFAKGAYFYWHVTIVDQSGNPVSGASVTTRVTKSDGAWYDQGQTTGANGVANFSKKTSGGDPVGIYTLAVTNVTKTGATYNAGANVISSIQITIQ